MRRATNAIAALLLGGLMVGAPARAAGAPEDAARDVVQTLVREAHQAITAEDVDAKTRMARVEAAVSDAFAFDVWQRFLVGDRDLTEAERETFRDLLPGFLAGLYAANFGENITGEPTVAGARPVRRDILVEASFPRADEPPLPVNFRLRAFEDRGYRVIDIMVGGVSFLLLKRDEFGALIEKDGVDALFAHMRDRAA